jgi:hypothetical protein
MNLKKYSKFGGTFMNRVKFYSPFLLVQGGSNMTGTCAACLHTNQSPSYLNHLVYVIYLHIFVMLFYQVQLYNEIVKPKKYISQSVYLYPTSITTIF